MRHTRVAGRGPDRAPHRRKASRIGNPSFFNASGGANDLGRKVPTLRSRARVGPGGDEASEPSPRSFRGVDNARAGRWDQLAVSGLGGVETPVQGRHTVLPW